MEQSLSAGWWGLVGFAGWATLREWDETGAEWGSRGRIRWEWDMLKLCDSGDAGRETRDETGLSRSNQVVQGHDEVVRQW